MKTIIFLFAFTASIVSNGQNNLQYISSTTGAGCYAVEYSNGLLYTGAGNSLQVYDVNTPVPYNKTFEYRFVSNIDDIKVHNNRLYVCANHDGLSVWDLTIPTQPTIIDQYVPDSLNQAAYNMAFYGDSILVSYKGMMAIFYFNTSNNSLSLANTFAFQTGNSFVRGVDVKNNLLAFTTAYGTNAQTGIHTWDIPTMTELSFYEQDFADPENVLFSQSVPLLNVLGGTESWQNGNPKGIFYSLNISNPLLPVIVHSDTLGGGFNFYIAGPISGQLVNDTLYFATNGMSDSLSAAGDTAGYVYVYDVSSPNNVHFITDINAGLWHFDVAVGNQKMYVASEWYGVKTLDITNIFSPVNLGLTLTGGWNCASDQSGNRMVVAQEGYGFKQFDISDLQHPVLINSVVTIGSCYGIHYDKTGNYIFSFNYTEDDFRIYRASDLMLISSLNPNSGLVITDYYKELVWQDKALAIQKPVFLGFGSKNVICYDVSDINNPSVDTILTPAGQVEDIEVTASGKLFLSTTSNMYVYDLGNNYQQLVNMPVTFLQQFHGIALSNDTLYAYVSGLPSGIEKYAYNGSNLLTQVGGTNSLPVIDPNYVAADAFGLYLDYQEAGLYAFDKSTITQTGYYKHGLEFYRPAQWGQRGLFCKDSLIFLVEYFGQTSILSNFDNLNIIVPEIKIEKTLEAFPNPVLYKLSICCFDSNIKKNTEAPIEIFNAFGVLLWAASSSTVYCQLPFEIDVSNWQPGIYFLRETQSGSVIKFIKL
ncbi:MAG: T9SS type A sorting domain-containing protein [Bacteroidota bacterium]